MSPPAPRDEYARRMHRVQRHIDLHLGEALDLATLAGVAHFSPFHFHRVFTAWTGETLGDHLRRRRLEVAALRLLTQPRSSVLDIALTVGFGSGEAFARAFRGRFDCSPSQWRQQGGPAQRKMDQVKGKPDQAAAAPAGQHGAPATTDPEPPMTPLNVTVIERAPVRVAYLRHVGPYGASVAAFWQQQFYPLLVRRGWTGRTIYGISHDDPAITAPEQLRYDTCVEIGADEVVGSDALVTEIPGGRYAFLPFEGTTSDMGPAWTALMRDWLPGSGWQIDGRPTFEHYGPGTRYDAATGVFDCDIVMPLAPL